MKALKYSRILGMVILISCCFLACSTSQKTAKVDTATGEGHEQILFSDYKDNRPEATVAKIGAPQPDMLFESIAQAYGTTLELTDKYISRVENSSVALKLERIRETKGKEAYQEEVNSLEGQDRQEFNQFAANEINQLKTVESYLTSAYKFQQAASKLDVKSFISNPLKAGSAVKSAKHATSQVNYSVKSLQWLNETRKAYSYLTQYAER